MSALIPLTRSQGTFEPMFINEVLKTFHYFELFLTFKVPQQISSSSIELINLSNDNHTSVSLSADNTKERRKGPSQTLLLLYISTSCCIWKKNVCDLPPVCGGRLFAWYCFPEDLNKLQRSITGQRVGVKTGKLVFSGQLIRNCLLWT